MENGMLLIITMKSFRCWSHFGDNSISCINTTILLYYQPES